MSDAVFVVILLLTALIIALVIQTRNWVIETRDRLIEALDLISQLTGRVKALDGRGEFRRNRYKNGQPIAATSQEPK